MSPFRALLPAFRLKTLPLACASIVIGTALAVADNTAHWHTGTFILTLLTALALQILSNIANDYGDGVKGTDARQIAAQPDGLTTRVTGNGRMPAKTMRRLLVGWAGVTLVLGVVLLINATESTTDFWVFVGLGLMSMLAAVTYTVGKRAYGYYGLGDVSVFIFFGLVGVLGSYYLQAHSLSFSAFYAAVAVGSFCVAVLNINNLRDLETDSQSGKHTFALCIGATNAKRYHLALITVAFVGLAAGMINTQGTAWLYLLTLPAFAWHGWQLLRARTSTQIGKMLPIAVQLTLACCVLFALGQLR